MNWRAKIAAFLHRLPYYALYPPEAEDYRQEVLAALWGDVGGIDPDQVERAATLAAGLDIPPFVQDLPEDCFRRQPCLIHPLSAQEFQLHLPKELSADAVRQQVLAVLTDLQSKNLNEEQLFLALWRLLPERLAENDPTGLGNLWHILPADPRIPSHTVWEQAAVRSAVAGALPEPALLLFTIASAQKAVSVARRTQDAWMGSFLLSYLSWQAIKAVAAVCGPDAIISPSLREQPLADHWLVQEKGLWAAGLESPPPSDLEIGSIPNIFAALVPAQQARTLAEKAAQAVADGWQRVTTRVRNRLEKAMQKGWQVSDPGLEAIWERQATQFIDSLGVFWVACPWGNSPEAVVKAVKPDLRPEVIENFATLLQNLQAKGYALHVGQTCHLLSGLAGRALTARKNLRQFQQVEEPGHKCSLCGDWEALHPPWETLAAIPAVADRIESQVIKENPADERHSYRWLREFWQALGELDRATGQKLLGRIRKGESLCSICLTRRLALEVFFEGELGLDRHIFPSTAGIATAAWRGRLLDAAAEAANAELAAALATYTHTVRNLLKDHKLPYPAAAGNYLTQRGQRVNKGSEFLCLDGDWLYPDSFEEAALKQAYGLHEPAGRQECQEAAAALLAQAKKCVGLGPLPKYYAILALDGDKMGEWVTSVRAPQWRWLLHPQVREEPFLNGLWPVSNYQRPLGLTLQLALSDSLKNFALYIARPVVEKDHAGKLIYAGGDDVLALLPLEHLLPVMQGLYQGFRGLPEGYQDIKGRWRRLLGGVRTGDPGEEQHEGMTISMAAIIVHHSYPLYHALELAPEVLKKTAKQKLGRDAWAVRLLRRSGESTEVGLPFDYDPQSNTCRSLEALAKIVGLLAADELSSRLPYRLSEYRWARGPAMASALEFDLARAQELEIGRLAKQHSKTGAEKKVAQVLHGIWQLLGDIKRERTESSNLDPWEVLTQLLLLGRFLTGRED